MVFRTGSQRPGRVPWAVGVLLGVFLALSGAEYWINLDRQVQNDEAVDKLQKAGLDRAENKAADPDDWPQWRGLHRDGSAPGTGLATTWPEGGPRVVWKKKGGPGVSSLAVANGRVITLIQDGDNEIVVCWDANNGDEKWRFPYESRFTREVVGPRSTPTIDGDLVYTVGARGRLTCLEAKSGTYRWHSDLAADFNAPLPKWGFAFSPLIEGDLLFTCPGGPNGNSIVAFDKKTGKVRWKKLDDPAGYSSPVISTAAGVPQVVFLTGTSLVSLDPQTGKLYWRFLWETPNDANVATPIALGNYVFVSSGYSMGCALVEVHKDGDGLGVRQVYKNNLMRNHYATCVFYKDYLYGFDEGYLEGMPFRAGKRRAWKEGKFGRGNLLRAGNQLIVLGINGKLALVEPTPEGYREKALCTVSENPCWTMPALAHGQLYLRDNEDVWCLDLR